MRRLALALAITAGLSLAGCVHAHYGLYSDGATLTVVPPHASVNQSITDGSFAVPLPSPAPAAPTAGCAFTLPSFSAQVEGGKLRLASHMADNLATGAVSEDPNVVIRQQNSLQTVQQLAQLRAALGQLDQKGCLGSTRDGQFLAQLTNTIPLETRDAALLRFGLFPVEGYYDLYAGDRLKETTPAMNAEGEIAGVATLYFEVAAESGGGERLNPLPSPAPPPGLQPRPVDLDFPGEARHFRLLLISRTGPDGAEVSHGNDIVAAATPEALDAATREVQASDGGCAAVAGNAWCRATAAGTILNAELPVWLQDQLSYVALGSTVESALRDAGVGDPNAVLRHLKVQRPYREKLIAVRFNSKQASILQLVLLGGEHLNW